MTVSRGTLGARRISAGLALLLVAGSTASVALGQSGVPTEFPDTQDAPAGSNEQASPFQTLEGEDVQIFNPDNAPAGDSQAMSDGEGVSVSEYMTVDLFVQDEDLANVLQMLSLQSQRNIVASRDVSARVTANLYGVTFFEALDAILHVNGYGYVERGNFIYVYTLEELEQIQAEARQIVSKVLHLDYLNANDAAEFVVPLLSDVGTIKTNGDVSEFQIPEDSPTGSEEFGLSATLVIFDYEEHVEEIEALLAQLDTRPAQVLVEATILQTQLNEQNAWGIDFAYINDVDIADFFTMGGALNAVNDFIAGDFDDEFVDDNLSDREGTAVNVTPGNTAGPGTLKVGVIHDDIALFVRMLDEVSDVSILSNPKVLALNRQPARVLVGRKLGFLNTTATETSTTQTVEFLDTGTQLAFRPFVATDGNIRMELKPRVSEGIIREASDATGAAVTIPDEITQEITTNVIVPDGSTIVLGGLFRESTGLTRRQVPFFGDIPIIGTAFRGHEDETDRNEIVFMIKPTIMSDEVMLEQGDRALAETERVRSGTRQGLLPWSRERQTAKLNMKAHKAARDGNLDRARYALRRSLGLNPNQPDALRLRELLTGEFKEWPSRSIIEDIISGEAARWAEDVLRNRGEESEGEEAAEDLSMIDLDSWFEDDGSFETFVNDRDETEASEFDPMADGFEDDGISRIDNADQSDPNAWPGGSDLDAGDWSDSDIDMSAEILAQAQKFGVAPYIVPFIEEGFQSTDWNDVMDQPWTFAQAVPALPFGMFWTVSSAVEFDADGFEASPAEIMTDALTNVEAPVEDGR